MMSRDFITGGLGTVGTFGLAELNHMLGCVAGVLTCAYMGIVLYREFAKRKQPEKKQPVPRRKV